jgi:hypothetical protein
MLFAAPHKAKHAVMSIKGNNNPLDIMLVVLGVDEIVLFVAMLSCISFSSFLFLY